MTIEKLESFPPRIRIRLFEGWQFLRRTRAVDPDRISLDACYALGCMLEHAEMLITAERWLSEAIGTAR